MLPNSFDTMFLLTSQIHNHNTRNANSYIPQCRTNIRQFSFRYVGPKFFNSLSFEIQNSSSVADFKHKLKHYLPNDF